MKIIKSIERRGAIFVVPSLIIVTFFTFVPLVASLTLSFFQGHGNNFVFSGFENYISMAQDANFLTALKNSIILTIIVLPLSIAYSFFIAIAIQKIDSTKLKEVATTLLFLPCLMSPVAYSLFFKQMAYPSGIIAGLLSSTGLVVDDFSLLQSVWGARLFLALICVWAWSGFYVLLFLSSIVTIDSRVIQAATLDGASKLTMLRKILIPSIRPILVLVVILTVTGTIQLFVESELITNGGPSNSTLTLTSYLYNKTFLYSTQYGYASAIAVVIFAVNVAIICLFYRVEKNSEE